MKKLELIKSRILPNRVSITKTYRDETKKTIVKEFINFDSNHIEKHYNWLQKLSCPLFPKILDIYYNKSIFIVLEDVGKRDFWNLCKTDWKEKTLAYSYEVIRFFNSWSNKFFNLLPPKNKIIHGDFHAGNILYIGQSNNFKVQDVRLIDLESIQIGNIDKMKLEILLNLFAHPILYNNEKIHKKILDGIPLSKLTRFERYKEILEIDTHFYDYYREFPNFYNLHSKLRDYLTLRVK